MIDGKTRTCGLIGNPVEHTMSPVIHNTLAAMTGQNLAYVPFHVEEGRLEEAVKGAYALNILGCNVTVPYKSDVIPLLKEVDPLAVRIGAVNTLVRIPGGYKGYNTDMPGLYRAMCSDGVTLLGESVLILGAGGVARAVAVLAAQNGAEEILLCNRTADRARDVAKEVGVLYPDRRIRALSLEEYPSLKGKKYLAVQATSVGMYPDTDRAVIEEPEFYTNIHTGYDMIFNPASTRFMKLTEEAGGRAYNGLKMLLYQGVIAYELWNGIRVEDEAALRVYGKMKQEMGMT